MESGSLRPIGPSGPTEAWEPGLACMKGGAKNAEVWGWELGTRLGREGGRGKGSSLGDYGAQQAPERAKAKAKAFVALLPDTSFMDVYTHLRIS